MQLSHGAVVHHSKEHRYSNTDVTAIGKRTAKTLAQCGAKTIGVTNDDDRTDESAQSTEDCLTGNDNVDINEVLCKETVENVSDAPR